MGSGPYQNAKEEGQERTMMGEGGQTFTVHSLDKNGILGYSEYGFGYIFMGKEHISATGTIMVPHKIKLKVVDEE